MIYIILYRWSVKRLQSRSARVRVKIIFTPRVDNEKPDRKNTSALFTLCIFRKWRFSLKQDKPSGCSGILVWMRGCAVGEGSESWQLAGVWGRMSTHLMRTHAIASLYSQQRRRRCNSSLQSHFPDGKHFRFGK